jgi:hypothetical protein
MYSARSAAGISPLTKFGDKRGGSGNLNNMVREHLINSQPAFICGDFAF